MKNTIVMINILSLLNNVNIHCEPQIRWQYICEHNFEKSPSIINFCPVVNRENFFHKYEKCLPHLNIVVRLACKNETNSILF